MTPLWHFHKPLRIFKSQCGKEKWTFTGHSWVTNYGTSANKFVSFASHPLWSLCIIFQHLSDFSSFLIIFSFPTSGQHRITASPACLAVPSLLRYEFLSLLHGHDRTNPLLFSLLLTLCWSWAWFPSPTSCCRLQFPGSLLSLFRSVRSRGVTEGSKEALRMLAWRTRAARVLLSLPLPALDTISDVLTAAGCFRMASFTHLPMSFGC